MARRTARDKAADALELERLRPIPRRIGGQLVCEWAPRCKLTVVGWAEHQGEWVTVCELHRAAARDEGVTTRERF